MQKFLALTKHLRDEEDGAAMVEYTILIGIITVAVIASVLFVGGWVGTQWLALSAALQPAA